MLTSDQFKFHLARYAKVKEEDASAFMEAVTQILLEKAQAGEEVTIQGLGTFVIIDSQQGRRLGFQVDDKMRKAVNAPFACFEPMTLAAEMRKPQPEPVETVEPVVEKSEPEPEAEDPVQQEDVPVEEPAVEDVPVVEDEPLPAAEEVPMTVEETPEIAEEPASLAEEEVPSAEETVEETPDAEELAIETPAVDQEASIAENNTEEVSEEEPSDDNVLEKTAPAVAAVAASSDAESKEEPAPTPAAPVQAKATPTRAKRPVEPTLGEQIQQYIQMFREGKAEPWMWGVLAVVALLLVLLIWLLIPSGKKEKKEVPAPVEKVAVAPADSAQEQVVEAVEAPRTEPAKPASASASGKRGSKPTDEMILHENGEPKKGKLGPGGRLTLLALRNYGDKAFWAYIYDVNAYQLGDPNNVPIGLPLYLPDPKYYGIDASDPASVKKAQLRARQILREWGEK